QRVRLVEEGGRRGDARKLEAAGTEPVEDLRPVEVRELLVLDDASRAREQVQRLAELALLHAGPGLAGEAARLELGSTGRGDGRSNLLELAHRLLVAVGLDERLGTGERGLDPAALVGGDAVREIAGVDVEPAGKPGDRIARRARLPALDLADVLLREALAGELALGQTRCDTQLTQALPEPEGGGA